MARPRALPPLGATLRSRPSFRVPQVAGGGLYETRHNDPPPLPNSASFFLKIISRETACTQTPWLRDFFLGTNLQQLHATQPK